MNSQQTETNRSGKRTGSRREAGRAQADRSQTGSAKSRKKSKAVSGIGEQKRGPGRTTSQNWESRDRGGSQREDYREEGRHLGSSRGERTGRSDRSDRY